MVITAVKVFVLTCFPYLDIRAYTIYVGKSLIIFLYLVLIYKALFIGVIPLLKQIQWVTSMIRIEARGCS